MFGKQFGKVFIGVQPTFGYEGDPMRLLFSRSASPHHGFAAYYTFLEHVYGADAVLHFWHARLAGVHAGEAGGHERRVLPDLIGSLPNSTTTRPTTPARPPSPSAGPTPTPSATSPPAENAGLYKGLKVGLEGWADLHAGLAV